MTPTDLSFPAALPVLDTPRLRLRRLRPEDGTDLLRIYGDPEVMRFAADPPFQGLETVWQMLDSVTRLFAQQASLEWGLERLSDGRLVGTCGLHGFKPQADLQGAWGAELGALLAREAWGQGLMREALEAVIDHARACLDLAALWADIDDGNARSERLFASLGFAPGTPWRRVLRP